MIVEGVLVDPDVAQRLAPVLRRMIAEWRRSGGRVPVEVLALVADLDALARASAAGHDELVVSSQVVGRIGPHRDTERVTPDPSAATLVPVAEVAARRGVDPRTVRRWIVTGRVAGRLIGGRWLVEERTR